MLSKEAPIFGPTTVDKYNFFIKTWGTHFLSGVHTGGVFRYLHFTDKLLLETMASGDVALQANIGFLNFIKASGGASGIYFFE